MDCNQGPFRQQFIAVFKAQNVQQAKLNLAQLWAVQWTTNKK